MRDSAASYQPNYQEVIEWTACMPSVRLCLDILKRYHEPTYDHCVGVAKLALSTARDLPEREVFLLGQAALLHDIGKIFVPRKILDKHSKDGPTPEEWAFLKLHPYLGYCFLLNRGFPRDVATIVRDHHKYQPNDYPDWIDKDPRFSHLAIRVAASDARHAMMHRAENDHLTSDDINRNLERRIRFVVGNGSIPPDTKYLDCLY